MVPSRRQASERARRKLLDPYLEAAVLPHDVHREPGAVRRQREGVDPSRPGRVTGVVLPSRLTRTTWCSIPTSSGIAACRIPKRRSGHEPVSAPTPASTSAGAPVIVNRLVSKGAAMTVPSVRSDQEVTRGEIAGEGTTAPNVFRSPVSKSRAAMSVSTPSPPDGEDRGAVTGEGIGKGEGQLPTGAVGLGQELERLPVRPDSHQPMAGPHGEVDPSTVAPGTDVAPHRVSCYGGAGASGERRKVQVAGVRREGADPARHPARRTGNRHDRSPGVESPPGGSARGTSPDRRCRDRRSGIRLSRGRTARRIPSPAPRGAQCLPW